MWGQLDQKQPVGESIAGLKNSLAHANNLEWTMIILPHAGEALSVASDEEKEALEKTIKAYQGRKTAFGIMVHSTRRASPSLRKRVGFRCQTTASRLPLARRSSGRAPQPSS